MEYGYVFRNMNLEVEREVSDLNALDGVDVEGRDLGEGILENMHYDAFKLV